MGIQTWEVSKSLVTELVTSPLNLLLLGVCVFLIYKIFKIKRPATDSTEEKNDSPILPKMKRQDFTVEDLAVYNGEANEEKRILVAVNQKVFDVTNKGRSMYGKGGPYAVFAGRDASRALATFSLDSSALKDTFDDLSDLNPKQLESLREWELQFKEKYDLVGKLLRPSEQPTEYSDTEDDQTDSTAAAGPTSKSGVGADSLRLRASGLPAGNSN
ncbi:hypothetical protein BOX15_Mlig033842g1 [Macrostomum lignano]|uniref:Cytochrome b5 heme-binding domain-containing protein n=1 Tax=Macrostomum lignano TaxID=282301 RepID=A0A267E856_9PLAT|nr:hypothetical protein BOX15_Mlig033842g1 [Macrostomum lignano]